ncbi:signal peptide peptidase SppA [Desulfospira joergensenii]|uniref:signal peptide peptidase SppA n=1 Tax=Desulfospira joergensenii TaxID=53329 RepID=UPI0003B3BDC0|nr:signal peptide peptidase SppA [Desulfospira joergensenii]
MFARRHPFLFFFMIISSCMTLVFLGFIGLAYIGSQFVGKGLEDRFTSSGSGNIGIVEVAGPILSSKKIIEQIRDFRKNENIKAIIIRIDSPGGGIGPSQEIYRELMKTRASKKVLASMGSVAASGGYYIASATQGIVANPGTITGSIGVIMEYANIMEIAKKIGISPVVIKSGEFKDMGSPLRELKENEKKILQDLVDELHLQFVNHAAKARDIKVEEMAKLADGRVYTGQTALALKLVDRLGNLDDTVQWAGELAMIQGELKPVYPKEDQLSFIRKLADTLLKDLHISGAVTDHLRYVIQ